MTLLTRRGVLVEDMGQTWLAEPQAEGEEARTLRPLQAAAVTYRIAFGPRAGQKVLKLKTPWRDGTTHRVMSPLEFMQRLAALVPRPRLHLIRFHGVLAPNAKLRPLVVPQGPPAQAQAAAKCEVEPVQARPHRIGWARLLKRVIDIDLQHRPHCCAGELKIIAAILERPAIEKTLTHLGIDPQPPPRGLARAAGQDFQDFPA